MALPILRRGNNIPVRRGDNNNSQLINRLDPWNDLALMDRMFDSFFRSPFSMLDRTMGRTETSEGNMELYEGSDELTAYIYAPGIAQDAFDISATEDTITVKAERKPLFEPSEGMTSHTPWSNLATSSGTFNTSYTLPAPIDPSKVNASYKDGVLKISMPKSEAAKPRQIKVDVHNG